MIMKRLFISIITIFATLPMLSQGWPEKYEGVMLQGFYWDGFADTQWLILEKQADNLSKVFDLVWLPQSGNCGGQSMGYDDFYWFPGEGRYISSFGTEDELRSLISTFKQKGIGTIADVVINHRKNVSNWVDFPKETYNGVTYELKSTDICSDDDNGATKTWANKNEYALGNDEQPSEVYSGSKCEDWSGMRDLDHTSTNVQNNVKAYLHMLLEDLKYDGFRYDMVKGYPGKYTALYNKDANPTFSVGEFWDGSASNCIKWLNATKDNDVIQSAVFDFPFRYTVRNALRGSNNDNNSNNWKQAANMKLLNASSIMSNANYRRYAVTFVENHDTEYRDAKNQQDPIRKDTLAANAYLLSMPGTPCVFYKHWLAYKQEIANMVAVRKAVGITNMSTPTNAASNENYYAVQVEGSDGKKLLCVVGKDAATYTPNSDAWKKVISGYHYVYYVQGVEPSAINLPKLSDDPIPTEVPYDGVPSFCKINDGEICAFFEAPVTWGAISHTWAWMKGRDGKEYLGVEWPGVNATLLGKAANGNKVFKWVSTKTTAPDNIIFSGAGGQTKDLPFVNAGYYTKDGLVSTVTTNIHAVKSESQGPVRIYSIDGLLLREIPASINTAEVLSQLKRGIYIVNGKKAVIR
jgi:alpha-amylase